MIQLVNVCKDYVMEASTVHALKNINISFRQNEFVAVLGPSGGGKTTLLNIIGGLDKYTSGDLLINGISTSNYTDRQWDNYRNHSVGFVFQTYNLIPHQTVLSNVELALSISGIPAAQRRQRAIDALKSVGLADQIDKKPNQLSGGQMQRVAIARAIVNNPDILLADEPTGALDTQSSLNVMEILKEVAKDRLVVMVTHNPELAQQYANRIIRIRDGEITDDNNPYELSQADEGIKIGKAKMNLLTAFRLSLNNMLSKFGRTLLTSFAGSIGIIGIALILSLSTGVNNYIDEVQTNSLSSYPLTIENNNADFTGIMAAMMGSINNTNKQDGKISEIPLATDLFSHIGTNDLKAFKRYLEANRDKVDPLVTALQYSYGIVPQVYKDSSTQIIRINPTSIFSSGARTSSAFSGANIFQRMIDNQQLLESQYDIVAGRWPQKYDECIMVVYDPHTISDFQVYAMGIRDPKELSELIKEAFNGNEISLNNQNMIFEYDYFLKMKFKVVMPKDYYRYNSEYDVWEDMRDDDEYMLKIINDSMDLKVVGIITAKEGVNSTSLQPGIAYRTDLIEYLISQAQQSQIVKEQLADKENDVFSRLSFEDLNEKNRRSNIDFSNMISVDRDLISSAFNMDVDENQMKALISNSINEALNSISADTAPAEEAVATTLTTILERTLTIYIEEHGMNGMASYGENDIAPMLEAGFADESVQQALSALSSEYQLDSSALKLMFSPLVESMLNGYLQMFLNNGMPSAVLVSASLPEVLANMVNNDMIRQGLKEYARILLESKMKIAISKTMASMSTQLLGSMAGGFNVDGDKLAQAFKFEMSEDELNRLMSIYTTGNTEANYDDNLTRLGYSDLDDPKSIALYFNDFASKDTFKDMIAQYNSDMEKKGQEEAQIHYTDITGILMSSITTIINAISYILIAFVSISLVVSSIMIGIITYISVLERTKEIGILRSLGASKRDVGHVFSAETVIIGLAAGVIGVLVTVLLCIPINFIVRKVTNIPTLTAQLPLTGAIVLIVISVILTLISGLIPSRMASKCDPVIALRSE